MQKQEDTNTHPLDLTHTEVFPEFIEELDKRRMGIHDSNRAIVEQAKQIRRAFEEAPGGSEERNAQFRKGISGIHEGFKNNNTQLEGIITQLNEHLPQLRGNGSYASPLYMALSKKIGESKQLIRDNNELIASHDNAVPAPHYETSLPNQTEQLPHYEASSPNQRQGPRGQ